MKKILFILLVAGSSVSFNIPEKKPVPEEAKKVNLNMLMIRYRISN